MWWFQTCFKVVENEVVFLKCPLIAYYLFDKTSVSHTRHPEYLKQCYYVKAQKFKEILLTVDKK